MHGVLLVDGTVCVHAATRLLAEGAAVADVVIFGSSRRDGVLEARVYVDCSALLAAVGGCNDPNGDDVLLLHRSLEDLRRPPCCGYGLRMLY